MVTKKCLICEKEFECYTGKSASRKYCSWKCKDIGSAVTRRMRFGYKVYTCLECGSEFHKPPSVFKKGNAKYCSWKCRVRHMRGINASVPYSRQEVHCEICGNVFMVNKYRIESGVGRFCSQKCMVEWRSLTWVGKNNPNWRDAMTERECRHCGNKLMVSKKEIARKHIGYESGKFCSKKCHSRSMILPGSTPFRGEHWPGQRTMARKRDGHKCRICGSTETGWFNGLDVHHMVPFRLFGYEFDKNNHDVYANDLSNLITLCRKCHKKSEGQHPIYFKPYIPEEQYLLVKDLYSLAISLRSA